MTDSPRCRCGGPTTQQVWGRTEYYYCSACKTEVNLKTEPAQDDEWMGHYYGAPAPTGVWAGFDVEWSDKSKDKK